MFLLFSVSHRSDGKGHDEERHVSELDGNLAHVPQRPHHLVVRLQSELQLRLAEQYVIGNPFSLLGQRGVIVTGRGGVINHLQRFRRFRMGREGGGAVLVRLTFLK